MSIVHIQRAIDGVVKYYAEHPEKAVSTDKAAVAVLEEGLLCKAEGADGAVMVDSVTLHRKIDRSSQNLPINTIQDKKVSSFAASTSIGNSHLPTNSVTWNPYCIFYRIDA